MSDFTTDILTTPYPVTDPYGALQIPVYNAVAFEFGSAAQMAAAFTGRTVAHAYSRISNPTVEHFEQRICRATGAMSATALGSGMAAISATMLALGRSGGNIVTSPHLFGNTYSLLCSTLSDFGVEIRLCDMTNPGHVARHIDDNTLALFLEVVTNPQLEVADLQALATVAHAHAVPLVVDSTVVPFNRFHAADFGVDIELVSSTKYISGGATSLGGLIIDYGRFDWSGVPKFKALSETAGSRKAFTAKLKREIIRNLGAYMTPRVAYMQCLGLETLEVRFERAASTCLALAKQLQSVDGIRSVHYTGLESSPFYEISTRQFGPMPGAMMTIEMDSCDACFDFLDRLTLIRRSTNLFDNKSLAIHPWSTIYGNFSEQVRHSMDIRPTTIRLSIGLEPCEMLLEDIQNALLV